MKQTISSLAMFAVALSAIVCITSRADAQMRPMMIPLTTTLVITKPAPGEIYGNKQVVTMGVGPKTYKFVLNDAFVDDASTSPTSMSPASEKTRSRKCSRARR